MQISTFFFCCVNGHSSELNPKESSFITSFILLYRMFNCTAHHENNFAGCKNFFSDFFTCSAMTVKLCVHIFCILYSVCSSSYLKYSAIQNCIAIHRAMKNFSISPRDHGNCIYLHVYIRKSVGMKDAFLPVSASE